MFRKQGVRNLGPKYKSINFTSVLTSKHKFTHILYMPKMPLRRIYLLRTLFFFSGKLQMVQNYRCKLKSLLHITPTSLIPQYCCIPWY